MKILEYKNLRDPSGHIKFELRRQGNFIFGLLIVFFGYFGIICNMIMLDSDNYPIQATIFSGGEKILHPQFDISVLIYSYETYLRTFFLPVLLLFGICFFVTYKEEIPNYGIKHAIWFVPIIILCSIIWYWVISGFSAEPLSLFFLSWKGYLTILILYAINISGAISGMKLKQFTSKKRET